MSRGYFFAKVCFVVLSVLFFSSCQNNDKIIGTWERYGDVLEGMRIKVVKEGEHLKGTIIYSTDFSKERGFAEGDVKWKNIKKMTDAKYEYEDLKKTRVPYSDLFEPSYGLSNLELVSENEIYTRVFSKGTEYVGTEQKWKRVKDE